MKSIIALLGGLVLLATGCAIEPAGGYYDSGASVSVYGEYPHTYYGHRGYYPHEYHREHYGRRYYAPYDRDHYLYRY